jgi:class 3 adenylate cyclase
VTLTFLPTDIEGSTRLWEEEHHEAMARALATHDRLISTAVVDHEGAWIKAKGEGDSTFVSSTARRRRSPSPWSCNWPLPARPTSTGRIAVGRRSGPGMTPAKATLKIVYRRATAPGCHLETNPSARGWRTTGVPDLFPGPVLASLRADPDRPGFEIGPRTVSRGDLLAMVRRLAAALRDPDWARAKASDWSFRWSWGWHGSAPAWPATGARTSDQGLQPSGAQSASLALIISAV